MTKLNTQKQCYAAGKRAFREGAQLTDNPCTRVTHGYSEWKRGWLERCRDKTPDAIAAALAAEKARHEADDRAHFAKHEAIFGKA